MKLPLNTRVKINDAHCDFGGQQGTITAYGENWDYYISLPNGYGDYFDNCEVQELPRTRGFKVINGHSVPMPTRATKGSAGYDIAASGTTTIPPHTTHKVATGLIAYMADDEWLGVYVRSSIGALGLTMANNVAVIDSDFNDHFCVLLHNTTDHPITINAGQKIAQGIFQKYLVTDDDNVTTERQGGIGSTD